MKGANRYEKFEAAVVERSEIHEAYYNPRKISDSNLSKLKRFLKSKKGGLLSPLTWNKQTRNLVAGHQRLQILDTLHKGKPYKLTVAVVDMEESEEVKANIFMNNPGAQGDWDVDKLHEIHNLFPDLDFTKDFAFEEEELDILGLDFGASMFGEDEEEERAQSAPPAPNDTAAFRAAKKRGRDQARQENANGDGPSHSKSDFTLTFIFPDSDAKRELLKQMGYKESTSRLNSQVLSDLIGAE